MENIFHENGALSAWLVNLGGHGADWMNTDFAFWILVFSYIWKNLGYNIVLWLAGLSCILKVFTKQLELMVLVNGNVSLNNSSNLKTTFIYSISAISFKLI